MQLRVDPGATVSPSKQLVDAVLDAVTTGDLPAGDKLPSVREAAVMAMVNPNTVAKAWRELATLGVVFAKNGSGVFVSDDGPRLARELRGSATLHNLRQALDQALGAGHSKNELLELVQDHLHHAPSQARGHREPAR